MDLLHETTLLIFHIRDCDVHLQTITLQYHDLHADEMDQTLECVTCQYVLTAHKTRLPVEQMTEMSSHRYRDELRIPIHS